MSEVTGLVGIDAAKKIPTFSGGKKARDVLVIGGEPRVHLLPAEIQVQKQGRAKRRGLVFALVAVVTTVVLGFALATLSLLVSNASLASETARAAGLLAASNKYGMVVQYQHHMNDITLAQPIAVKGEIDWQPFIQSLQQTLPSTMMITNLSASIDSARDAAAVATAPLQGSHVATIKINANDSTMTISDWLDNLKTINGFVDATPGGVSRDASTGHYLVQVSLHVDLKALSNRFQEKK